MFAQALCVCASAMRLRSAMCLRKRLLLSKSLIALVSIRIAPRYAFAPDANDADGFGFWRSFAVQCS
ncbi:MAG: hypothetical protein LBH29_06600 [Elusimicrobiota bacterium]|nr:hypothetical protein [Elusimicrobiota bacterium]